MRITLLTAILLSAVCTSCQYDPWAGGFATKEPSRQDVVGTYRVDSDSLQQKFINNDLKTLTLRPTAAITLNADGTARFVDVPFYWPSIKVQCFYSHPGSWSLARIDGYWKVEVVIKVHPADSSHCPPGQSNEFGEAFDLYGDKPPYKLHLTLGDPDTGDAVQFEKVSGPN